jgi:hypothetical protein
MLADQPFDAEGERQRPWWGNPLYRAIPRTAVETDIVASHLHIAAITHRPRPGPGAVAVPVAGFRRHPARGLTAELRKDAIMARAGTKILDSGEVLPSLSMDTVAHGRLTVPDHFGQGWGVFLLYRAHW